MSDTQNNKYKSRKFRLVVCALAILALVEAAGIAYGFLYQDLSLAEKPIPFIGAISIAYIGGNVAQKYTAAGGANESE